MATVFRGTRDALRRRVYQLVAILSGRAGDSQQIARQFGLAIGFEFLTQVNNAYDDKAQGRSDEMGYQWQPLAPSTLERRRGATRPNPERIQRLNRFRNNRMDFIREEENRHREYLSTRGYNPDGKSAKRIARQVAKAKYKGQEDVLRAAAYGNVEILKDTGVLFNSLTPGELSGPSYSKPSGEGGDLQILEHNPGEVRIGTNVSYARVHQEGSSRVPARPFLPVRGEDVPVVWWTRVQATAHDTLTVISKWFFSQ